MMRILSVRPSHASRVYCDKTVERAVQIYIPYERSFSLVSREEEWLVGERLLLPEILGQPTPVAARLSLQPASAVLITGPTVTGPLPVLIAPPPGGMARQSLSKWLVK